MQQPLTNLWLKISSKSPPSSSTSPFSHRKHHIVKSRSHTSSNQGHLHHLTLLWLGHFNPDVWGRYYSNSKMDKTLSLVGRVISYSWALNLSWSKSLLYPKINIFQHNLVDIKGIFSFSWPAQPHPLAPLPPACLPENRLLAQLFCILPFPISQIFFCEESTYLVWLTGINGLKTTIILSNIYV